MSLSTNFLSTRFFMVLLVLGVFSSCGYAAQNTTNTVTPPQETIQDQKTAKKNDEKKEPPKNLTDPDAKELSGRAFVTADRVLLSGSFYPGHADKDTVPVILLHGQGKSREEFAPLIEEMKKRNYAILAFSGERICLFPITRV